MDLLKYIGNFLCLTSLDSEETSDDENPNDIYLKNTVIKRYGHLKMIDILSNSISNGDIVTVNWLINNGFDIHYQNEFPMKHAYYYNQRKIIKILLLNGADISVDGYVLLFKCVHDGNLNMIKTIVKYSSLNYGVYDMLIEEATRIGNKNMINFLFANRLEQIRKLNTHESIGSIKNNVSSLKKMV